MKKGFTLIELLAVIVILAIIALIAVPIVINIINDAKEESLKRSVQYYLDAVTNTITKENLKVKYSPDECIIQEDGNLICSENGNELTTSDGTKILKIDIKGKKPSSGTNIGKGAFYGCTGLTNVTFENTSGWFTARLSSATTGDSIDVTNASTNAINLVSTYSSKYWKRSI